jgi:pimeloyl-ACP methyl ester carboxylesterase
MEQQIGFCTTEDGVRIAYATYGGDGPPIFVLPDIVGQEALWKHADGRRMLETLARGRQLITYDARFTGASERGGEHSSLECWVRDITGVVDHLALDQLSLFSVGGISSALALLYAAAHPERLAAVDALLPQRTDRDAELVLAHDRTRAISRDVRPDHVHGLGFL